MDDIDRQLLSLLKLPLPYKTRPFQVVGDKMGLDSADVILRIRRLKDEKVLDRVSAIFESQKLGYKSCWAAMSFPEESVDGAARKVSAHPAVFSCYRRNHEFNLWFALAVPGHWSIEEEALRLQFLAGAGKILLFQNTMVFKQEAARVAESKPVSLSLLEIEIIRLLQEDLSLSDEPYRRIAKQLGLTDESLFEIIVSLERHGFLNRIAALPELSSSALRNFILSVWQVPEERLERIGRRAALLPELKICCARTAFEEFPYNLHLGIESSSLADCERVISKIQNEVGKWPHQFLINEKEYKRTRIQFFSKELEEWREKTNLEGFSFSHFTTENRGIS